MPAILISLSASRRVKVGVGLEGVAQQRLWDKVRQRGPGLALDPEWLPPAMGAIRARTWSRSLRALPLAWHAQSLGERGDRCTRHCPKRAERLVANSTESVARGSWPSKGVSNVPVAKCHETPVIGCDVSWRPREPTRFFLCPSVQVLQTRLLFRVVLRIVLIFQSGCNRTNVLDSLLWISAPLKPASATTLPAWVHVLTSRFFLSWPCCRMSKVSSSVVCVFFFVWFLVFQFWNWEL